MACDEGSNIHPAEALVSWFPLCVSLSNAELLPPFCHPPTHRYDIKGCEVSRWVEPAPEGSPLVLVLKDLNFQGKTIDLGEPWRQSVPSFPPFRVK